MTYITDEPEKVSGYRDKKGVFHRDRDDAILANLDVDLSRAVSDYRHDMGLFTDSGTLENFLRHFVIRHPDLVRVLLGDRDAT